MSAGSVVRVDGPVVEVSGLDAAAMLDLVEVGASRLPGEIIALEDGVATVQVYEYTGGLQPGEDVVSSGRPLTAELGPGLLGSVFDGMLRRLGDVEDFLAPGVRPATLPRDRRFDFTPLAASGERGRARSPARDPRRGRATSSTGCSSRPGCPAASSGSPIPGPTASRTRSPSSAGRTSGSPTGGR